LGDDPADREADEDVRARERLRQRLVFRVGGELGLELVEPPAIGPDDARGVTHHDVLALHAQGGVEPRGRDGRRAGPGEDDVQRFEFLVDDVGGVQKRRPGDDRRPVLVVVEDGDVDLLAETGFDLEALRRFDVFEVDPTEGRLHRPHRVDDIAGVR